MKKQTFIINLLLTVAVTLSIASCSKEQDQLTTKESSVHLFQEKEIRQFSSSEDVVSAMNDYSIQTRSDDGFVSYLETVMEEPGYDDQPYAILSDAFGSLLNPNGELVFGNNLLHVSK